MAVAQPPSIVEDGCYTAQAWRHVLLAAANGNPGILSGLEFTGVSGRDITISEGAALIDGPTFDEGFTGYYQTSDEVLTISPGHVSFDRIDLIVARTQAIEFGDASNLSTIEVVTGTAAASPVAPTPAFDRYLILATVYIEQGATVLTSDDVVQTRNRAGVSAIPVGAISIYGGSTAPDGWELCDGSSLNRAAYPDLFAAIGTTYGAPSGSTFAVPDLRGRVPIGAGTGSGLTNRVLGTQYGAESVVLVANNLPAHTHGMAHNHPAVTGAEGGHAHGLPGGISYVTFVGSGGSLNMVGGSNAGTSTITGAGSNHTHTVTVSNSAKTATDANSTTGSGVDKVQPSLALNFIIRAT